MTDPTPEEQWPAVDAAYAFVLPSYQLLAGRFEAADNRIASLITTSSTVTFAAPILARAVDPAVSFTSGWFMGALFVFAAIVGFGLLARMRGVLTLPNPSLIYPALGKQVWRFKSDAVFFAGEHFNANARAINAKGNWSIALTLMVVLEVFLLIAWMAR